MTSPFYDEKLKQYSCEARRVSPRMIDTLI